MERERIHYLEQLAELYPTIGRASTEIINLQSILYLPKGTEHFLSDIHGEFRAFSHVLRNGSGAVRKKIDDVFGHTLSTADKMSLATLIYYPQKKIELVKQQEEDMENWYKITLYRLIEVCKTVSSKYTRSKVRKALPEDYAYVIEELITEKQEVLNKEAYYEAIVNTIVELGQTDNFIVALAELIQRLVIDHLHILGDIYDRGPAPHFIMDRLMQYHSLDIQWGNHDVVWMGAAAGQKACIATVVRNSIRYGNLDILEDGYGINMLPLATFVMEAYKDDPCEIFAMKGASNYNVLEEELGKKMHKAIAVIQFKLEGKLVRRHKEFQMEDRALLHRINPEKGTITLPDGKEYPLRDNNFPTIDWKHPYELTAGEKEVMDKLSKHEIDCFVSVEESRWEESDISPLTSIGETEIYFAINPERPDIKEALDSAMRRIKDDNPFYTDDLYRRYLSAQSSSFLSKEESEWIGQHGAIRIGYLNQDGGISSVDPSTGKLTGVITDYVDLAENCLQGQTLEFELKGYDTRSELLQALQDGKIDLIFHANQNPYFAETNGFALSDTLLTLNMAAITAKDSFDENKENTVAVEKDNFALKAYLSYNYPQWEVVEYETSDAAVKAMQKGETDCIVSNSGTVSDYLKNNKLHSVFLTKEADVPFAIQQGEPVLLSILNKTLTSMPTTQFSGAVVSYNASSRKVTAKDFIQDNLLTVSLIAGISFFVVLCIILDSLKKSKRAEEKSKKSAEQALKLNQELEEKQQELQNALVEAQSANKAKTSFLNNMSHDIRTPINGIMGMLTILEKSGNDGERAKDCLNKINESSKLLLSLVNDVLDMAKLESDTVVFSDESINLDQVCQEITESLSFQAEEKGLHVIGEHDDYSGIYVWSNAVHLKKILMNLFTNSMKYNKVNGFIYMSMRTIERSEDHMTCEFKIKDNGIGMSEEFIKNELFTPFVQADNSPRSDYNGTGLGMPIVKQLVEKMGGTITVESKLGEGSCFTVILPFKIDTNARPEEKEDFDADISDIRVLLVEDNELNVEIAEFMLTENGAKVETVKNGLEAVQHFEACESGTYDVILMDVMMPVMDGLTATKTIRSLERQDAKTIPIIAMTANAFREDAEKCMEAGMNAHLAKPLDDEKIKQTISEELRKQNACHE